jgi:hypothetical protein
MEAKAGNLGVVGGHILQLQNPYLHLETLFTITVAITETCTPCQKIPNETKNHKLGCVFESTALSVMV